MGDRVEDGGPAFPKPLDPYPNAQGMESGSHGMSLRDWFAGQALPTLLDLCRGDNRGVSFADHVAENAYEIADAMLKARSKASPHV